MIKETNVTIDYLKATNGKFDLETIFILELKEKNITKLNAIIKCKNLTFLNLSKNKLSSIIGIEVLKELTFLDLSFNQIFSLDGLENLTKLKFLRLQGNKVDKQKDLLKLKGLSKLEKLFFQDVSHNEITSNPICKIPNYRSEIFKSCLNLKMLDGIKKDFEVFSISVENVVPNEQKLEPINFNFKDSKNFKF